MTAIEVLRDELMLSPPRTARIVRMTVVVALVVVVAMAKRVPEAAASAYIVFFIAQRDVATTVGVGVGAVAGVTLAIAQCLLCYMVSLGEPALRVPLMVALAFAGLYAMLATRLGVIGLILGFITFYSLTFADWVPSPEALVRALMWLWVVIAYPIGLLVLADLAFGSRPAEIYRSGVAERLAAAAAFLGDHRGEARARLERYGRLGAAELRPYVPRSGPTETAPLRSTLLRQTELLGVLLRQLPAEILHGPAAQPALQRARVACEGAAAAIRGRGGATAGDFELLAAERREVEAMPPATRAVVLPLVTCVQTIVLSVDQLARRPSGGRAPLLHLPASPPPADATEGVRFALKVTLAATVAYLVYTGLDWYSIHTATITCFFVAGGSVGATIHKLTLRLTGAIVGATLGFLAIMIVLPALETIGGLTVVVAAVTLLAAWIATGSERISYAGFQLALAFYLSVLQGYDETTKLYVGRDRVIGIVLGNVLMSVVFTSLWPVRAEPAERRALARAVAALAAMLRAAPDDRDALDRAEATLAEQVATAREYGALVWFERVRGRRDLLPTVVQGLFIPVHAIARTPVPATASPAARAALADANAATADWLDACARAIAARTPVPAPPAPTPAVAALDPLADDVDETTDTRAHARQQREWLALVRAHGVELAGRVPP